MNTELFISSLSPRDHAALIDAAKRRATELRREAIRDFWSAMGRGTRCAWHAMRRRLPASRTVNRLEA
ncbi:MAG TPA: hypothetical protein VKI18_01785 [Albitalea sp.]|nr:hypothetical protein [Albitalea sp.]